MSNGIADGILLLMQFYTFLETSVVALSLLPHFIAFFSDDEIPETPSTLATTFLAFGKVSQGYLSIFFVLPNFACSFILLN